MEENKKTKKQRVNFTTTYDPQVLNTFKESCQEINVPIGIVLETFMKHFSKGDFILGWDMKNGYKFETK